MTFSREDARCGAGNYDGGGRRSACVRVFYEPARTPRAARSKVRKGIFHRKNWTLLWLRVFHVTRQTHITRVTGALWCTAQFGKWQAIRLMRVGSVEPESLPIPSSRCARAAAILFSKHAPNVDFAPPRTAMRSNGTERTESASGIGTRNATHAVRTAQADVRGGFTIAPRQ